MTATPLRLGMVGGGEGAFIGAVHRMAARLDRSFDLVAGCFASTPERSAASGRALGIDPDRTYPDYATMARVEAARADGIDAVSIVTPNHLHHPVACAFLEAGIDVICDKPMTTSLADAQDLARRVAATGRVFVLTHNYSAYPMIRQARAMVAAGELGAIRTVQVEYAQGWLSTPVEKEGLKQAEWRTDPARSGPVGCTGDIGTHAFNLALFVSGLEPESLLCDLATFVPGRRLDDNNQTLLRFAGGARGSLWASQVAPGNENALRLRIHGEKGSIDWAQESPEQLRVAMLGRPGSVIVRGGAGTSPEALALGRLPPGHPEGYLEGFATLYAEAAALIRHRRQGLPGEPPAGSLLPGVEDGVMGMRYIAASLASSEAGGVWTPV